MKLLTEHLLSRRGQDAKLWANVVIMSLKAQFSDGVNLVTQIKQLLDRKFHLPFGSWQKLSVCFILLVLQASENLESSELDAGSWQLVSSNACQSREGKF